MRLLTTGLNTAPTSKPQPDPGNGGFIYQRYQRGIMHFDASCACTQGILVGEYFKAVITAKNLPTDLAADMQGSRFYGQYNPSVVGWVARPGDLQGTDMTGAFEPGTAAVAPGAGTPSGTVTVTANSSAGCTITLPQTSCQLTFTGQGNKTIGASYAGDASFLGSVAQDEPHAVHNDPDLALTKDNFAPHVVWGETTSYEIVVGNIGSIPVANATLTDDPPAALTDVTRSSAMRQIGHSPGVADVTSGCIGQT